MAVGAFPLFKLGFLVVKQISKPIANALARRAKSSRIFREYVCIPVAQMFHWYDVKVRMRILNLGKVTTIPKLNEEKAIETGSQLLSEFIILSIASGLVIFEYRRSSEKEEAKQEQLEREKLEIKNKLTDLEILVDTQAAQIRELSRLAYDLEEKQRSRLNFFKKDSSSGKAVKEVSHQSVPGQTEAEGFANSEDSTDALDVLFDHPSTGSQLNLPVVEKGVIMDAVHNFLEGCPER